MLYGALELLLELDGVVLQIDERLPQRRLSRISLYSLYSKVHDFLRRMGNCVTSEHNLWILKEHGSKTVSQCVVLLPENEGTAAFTRRTVSGLYT